jgi:hypothetical protein
MSKIKKAIDYRHRFFDFPQEKCIKDNKGKKDIKGYSTFIWILATLFLVFLTPSLVSAICFRHPLDSNGWYLSQDFGVWNSDWN